MARKDTDTPATDTPLFTWDGAAADARTSTDAPTLFGLAEIPIRPTTGDDTK